MMRRPLRVATAALLLLACRSSDKDTYVVIHSDVNCDVPRVFQLRITISSGGTADQKMVPETAGAEMNFPSSLTLVMPGSRSGSVDVVVEAVDGSHQVIGRGTASGTLIAEDRIDLKLLIASATGAGSSIVFGTSTFAPDGGTSADAGKSDVTAESGVAFLLASAGSLGTCAVRADSSLWCWGSNQYGQLHLSDTSTRLAPAQVSPTGWSTVVCGQTHTCGIRVDGSLACWGNKGSGQLGAATATDANQQVEVPDGPWQSLSAGIYQTCAIKADETLWCWGDNTNGQLGTGNTAKTSVPVQVGGTGYTQVSARFMHTCALKQDGTLWCWGLNSNRQLGTDLRDFLYQPEQVKDSDWQQLATGLYHTCGLKQDRSLWCWGGNMSGQLGNASLPVDDKAQTATPQSIAGTWASVSAGTTHTCGIMTDGSLWCWGDNSSGQLGIASKVSQGTPAAVTVPGVTWARVTAGMVHTCAVGTDGSLWCWGKDADGELGNGSSEDRLAPTRVVR